MDDFPVPIHLEVRSSATLNRHGALKGITGNAFINPLRAGI
jgi:hypothetical protein